MIKTTYKIGGMHCASCATMIELDLEDAGIAAKCKYNTQTLEVDFDGKKIEEEKIKNIVKNSGYNIV